MNVSLQKYSMEQNIIADTQTGNEISIKEVILKVSRLRQYILSKWITILTLTALGMLLGFAYAHFKKPIYTAATTFVLEEGDKGGGLGQYAGLASMVGIDLGAAGGGGIFQGDNILALYKSRTMIEKTLLTEVDCHGHKQTLIENYIAFNHLRSKWSEIPGLKDIEFKKRANFTRTQDSVLGKVVEDINRRYLNVDKPDKKLSILKVEVKAADEFFAKRFNEEIVKNVNDFYVQTKTKKSLVNVSILQQKTDSVRAVMNGAIFTGASIADATPNLNPTRQVQRIAPMQRSQFNAETNKEILGELVKNLELSKISLRKEMPLIQVIDEPVFPLTNDKVGKLKGIVLGGFIMFFLTVLFLIIRRIFKSIMA